MLVNKVKQRNDAVMGIPLLKNLNVYKWITQ